MSCLPRRTDPLAGLDGPDDLAQDRVFLEEELGHVDLLARDHVPDLEGVGHGLSPVVVVGDDVDLAALLAQRLDAADPVLELVRGVEVIVAVVAPGPRAEPVLAVPAVEADVGEVGGRADGRRRDRIVEERLVDVAEGGPLPAEGVVKGGRVPAPVADLDRDGIAREQIEQPVEILAVLRRVAVGPGELDEQGGQPAPEMEDVGRRPEGVDVLPGEARPGVGERLVELQRQEEVRAGLDPLQPGADQGRVGRAVEGAVDLDDVDDRRRGRAGRGSRAPSRADRRCPPSPRSSSPRCRYDIWPYGRYSTPAAHRLQCRGRRRGSRDAAFPGIALVINTG